MKVTGSIVTYNNSATIERCLSSILEMTEGKDYQFELTVYDNASTDNTTWIIENKFPSVKLIKGSTNKGFGAGHNYIIKRVRSDYHFVINPDIYMDMDAIGTMIEYLEERGERIGLITPKVLNNDGTEQYLPKFCPTIRYVFVSRVPGFHYLRRKYTRADEKLTSPTAIEFCTGCFFGARTAYLKKLKGFSNRYFMYLEDTDLSRRVRQEGKDIIFYPKASVYHNWQRDNTGYLKGIFRFIRSLITYFNKWGWEF